MSKIKKQIRERNKDIAKTILKAVGLTTLVAGVIVFPGLAHVVNWVEKESGESSNRVRRSFDRMQKRGMVQVRKKGKKTELILTPKGTRWFMRYSFEDQKQKRPSKWDGLWRIVMFDIPEGNRDIRNLIRGYFKKLGFARIQKSVFIYPYPCFEVIQTLRRHFKLEAGELYIFEAKALEGEKDLKKHFLIR